MHCRIGLIILVALFLGEHTSVQAATSKQVQSVKTAVSAGTMRSTRKVKRSTKKVNTVRRVSHRLVPPPPAYMPTILPELYYQRNVAQEEVEEVAEVVAEKPKIQYVRNYSWGDSNVPKAVQARSGVTTWATTH